MRTIWLQLWVFLTGQFYLTLQLSRISLANYDKILKISFGEFSVVFLVLLLLLAVASIPPACSSPPASEACFPAPISPPLHLLNTVEDFYLLFYNFRLIYKYLQLVKQINGWYVILVTWYLSTKRETLTQWLF